MGDQNTRPQPSDEPGAYLKEWSAEGCPCKRVDLHPYLELWLQNLNPVVTPLYPASALEAARREDQARIAALEADNARLIEVVQHYGNAFCEGVGECVGDFCGKLPNDACSGCYAKATLAKIKENSRVTD